MTSLYEDDDIPDEADFSLRNCVWGFKCDKSWESLTRTNNSHVRFCGSCQKEVHLCDDDESLVHSIALNRCIAIYPDTHIGEHEIEMGSMIYEPHKD
jgi:hypothetical protein